ncbi:MAG: MATE family efflux transporter [Fusobacteriaceae bacterium]|jgi:putative MATE family efflux protein|nr:MATE family efflux transporter [Fusobacteriaceae bacterium]
MNEERNNKKKREIPEFYKMIFSLGIPIVIQQLVTSSLNFVDNLMIGRLGENYIAAVGFANSLFRIYDLFLFGINSGMGIFIAQYYGKKDFATIRKIFGSMIRIGLLIGFLFTVVVFARGREILTVYTRDPLVLDISMSYLRRVVFSYMIFAVSFGIGLTCRSIGKTKVPLAASALGVMTNTLFNYALIYGHFGLPALKEQGAAIATVLARVVELTVYVLAVYKKDYNLKGKLGGYFRLPKQLLREIWRRSLPVFLTESLWIIGVILLDVAYAQLGIREAASMQMAGIVMSIGAIVFMGLASSAGVMIGHTIGEGNFEKVKIYSRKIIGLSVVLAALVAVLVELLAGSIVALYKLDPGISAMAEGVIRIAGVFMFFKLIDWSILLGLFRAGGDTKSSLYLETLPNWLLGIPIAFTGVYFKVPVHKLMIFVESAEILKCAAAFIRYRSFKWMIDVTVKEPS